MKEFSRFVESFDRQNDPLLILGYFIIQCDWQRDEDTKQQADILRSINLRQNVPEHKHRHDYILDLVIYNEYFSFIWTMNTFSMFSDNINSEKDMARCVNNFFRQRY